MAQTRFTLPERRTVCVPRAAILMKKVWTAAVRLAHAHGSRVYVTCNTLPRNAEMDRLPAFLQAVQAAGADALIICDLGVMAMARRYAPDCGCTCRPSSA